MTEQWIQITIKPAGSIWFDTVREPIFEAMRELLTRIRETVEIPSFHFFHEYGNIELRIRTDTAVTSPQSATVKGIVYDYLANHASIEEYTLDNYEPELDQYGTDGWPIAQAFFEACSRFTLTEFNGNADLGDWYSVSKMVHCLLNQYFANRNYEAQFHADELCTLIASGYKMSVAYNTMWRDSIKSAWAGHGCGDWKIKKQGGVRERKQHDVEGGNIR